MKKRIPVGISDFKKIVTDNYLFADKTLLIKDILYDGSECILFTRPRRFGKTINLSMLQYFFSLEQVSQPNIFAGLKISEFQDICEKYQNKFPVIYISFKDAKKTSFDLAYEYIKVLISQLFLAHRYILDDNILSSEEQQIFSAIINKQATDGELQLSLKNLSEYLFRKYKKKVLILIDEYDAPLQEAYLATVATDQDIKNSSSYYSRMIELMRGIFGQAIKDNSYLEKSVITGIMKISHESMFSGLNNITAYSLLKDEYGQYFGFTEEEVEYLIANSEMTYSKSEIQTWYNGYNCGDYILYNPWSIVNYIKSNGELEPYWIQTGGTSLIEFLIGKSDSRLKQQFEKLILKQEVIQEITDHIVFSELERSGDAIWSLLLYSGYLNINSREKDGTKLIGKIAIPNLEVWYSYRDVIQQWFNTKSHLTSYKQFIHSLVAGEIEGLKYYIQGYISQAGSYFDFNKNSPEQVFHTFILGIIAGLAESHIIRSNQETGFGRADITLVPKNKMGQALVIEFKSTDKYELLSEIANKALEQIKNKQYANFAKQHGISHAHAFGFGFCGNSLEIAHELITL